MLVKNNDNRKTSITIEPLTKEKQQEEEAFRDILLLLQNLLEREEKTVLMVIDCLYEIGSVHLINKKIASKPVNDLLKAIRRFPKPAFKVIALYLVKKKAPLAITQWLYAKVKP